jgi:hypothetical protein
MTAQAPDAVAEAIALLHRAGHTWHLPLLQAARQGLIALRFIRPGERVPVRALDPTALRLPAVAVLCGDDHSDRCRPSDFPQAARWLRWARAFMLHGTGGREEHYAEAVAAALHVRRVLVVDLPSRAVPEWLELARRVAPKAHGLMLLPPPGAAHPIAQRPN